ncbi:glycerol kinase [Botrytis cinerea]
MMMHPTPPPSISHSDIDSYKYRRDAEYRNIEAPRTEDAEYIEHIEQTKTHLPEDLTQTEEEEQRQWFIGSIDQGTTSTRFIIFNGQGQPVAMHQHEFENMYPESGWHEHDPQELVNSVDECVEKATEKFLELGHKKSDIKAIGITNQRETTICWDTITGEPLYNAVVWADTRTTALVRELKDSEGADEILQLCGLPLSTYPASVKLMWMYRNVEAIKNAYDEGRLSFGTVDSWLIYKLNGGKEGGVHVTDTTNASRTMFMNLHTLQYDDKLLNFFQLDRKTSPFQKSFLPQTRKLLVRWPTVLLKAPKSLAVLEINHPPWSVNAASSLYPNMVFWLLSHTIFGNGRKPVYALEGSIAVAGSGVKFLMNNLGFIAHSSKITELAETVDDNGGVVFVTAFSGLFAPYWIDDAKGTLFGVTQHTQRGHIARATLEATCFQTKAILDAMEKDSGHKLEGLAVDGGMSNSDLCMQTQADVLNIPINRPVMRETTALGAAIAAGFAVGIWKEFDELKEINRDDRTIFEPKIKPAKAARMFKKWGQAVEMSRGWVLQNEDENDDDVD